MTDGAAKRNADADTLVLKAFLPYRLMHAYERVSRDFAAIYGAHYDLSRPEWRCLATIGEFGRITATAIGRHSSMHKTKVSRAVFALEKRRWVRRDRDDADRRSEHLTLTAGGEKAYHDLVRTARSYEQSLREALGAEADALERGLDAIETATGARRRRPA